MGEIGSVTLENLAQTTQSTTTGPAEGLIYQLSVLACQIKLKSKPISAAGALWVRRPTET